MFLLFVYIAIALGFSFICSVAEAVLLSVTSSHIVLLEQQGHKKLARRLGRLKDDINSPLAAILTLNTFAHTGGAAGVGAQATVIFGDKYLGITSAILTFLILVFSEIIPKSLGAYYWRQLVPMTSIFLKYLIIVLYPFVKLSALITSRLSHGPSLKGFNREEFLAIAELSSKEGQLSNQESTIIKNTLHLHQKKVTEILTPRTVVFSIDGALTIEKYFIKHPDEKFSRIPVYEKELENITGFVLRSDLLLAKAQGQLSCSIVDFIRPIHAIPESLSLSKVLHHFLKKRDQILLVIDEHGGLEGVVTIEDIFEEMIGTDIVDESDKAVNLRRLAFSKRKLKLR